MKSNTNLILNADTRARQASAVDDPNPDISPEILFFARVLCIHTSPTGPTGIADTSPIIVPQIKLIKKAIMVNLH